jgi:hypothetical protein
MQVYPSGRADDGFMLSFNAAPQFGGTYTFQYLTVQPGQLATNQ